MVRHEGPAFIENPSIDVLYQKRREIAKYGHDLYGFIDDKVTKNLIKLSCALTNVPITTSIVEFALNFEEDVAIMHNGILQAICFCFPSSWIPRERVGLSLMDIHKPVADNDKLVSASQKIAETMATVDCFRRYVWTISNSIELNQHPKSKSNSVPNSIDELYFRTETQTTMPLNDGVSSLFFVKVDTYPLIEIWDSNELRIKIIDSINSMSDAVLDYKNLRHIKALLC